MKPDKEVKLDIALGHSAKTKKWTNTKMTWPELVRRLSECRNTGEKFSEYLKASKEDQSRIKDVGGYVGGYLRESRRKPENVLHRQVLTLDIDFAHLDFWGDFTLNFTCAAVLHSSHKHHEKSPRFRLVIPLDRPVSPDEYSAISRQVAGWLDIELFDSTTFETCRLMFWPSRPDDVEYYFEVQEGEFLSADEILATYTDWTDSSAWPVSASQLKKIRDSTDKQVDPELKKGIVGAFCRTYTITEAIESFLTEDYQATDNPERFTFLRGSTSGGLIVYDEKFAYSHHGTDPAGGLLSNAFDLVRVHKFGHLDKDSDAVGVKLPSYREMEEFARDLPDVKATIGGERMDAAIYDFATDFEPDPDDEGADTGKKKPSEWLKQMEVDNRGKFVSSAVNLNLIFSNDIRLKGMFRFNRFDKKAYVYGNLPWRKVDRVEPLRNVDYSGIRNYIETIYNISAAMKIDDVLNIELEKNGVNPVLDYLKSQEWDGTPRVETLLIDYLGAEDNIYTREATRVTIIGAISRIIRPGCKFDTVLTLVGGQGHGKSTLVNRLGGEWYSDSMTTVQGKEAFEQLQGAWIIELAELSGLRKAEVESIKHFLTKQVDMYRAAYGRATEVYPRQCIFIGTTNDEAFLKDPTGNRRFLPVEVRPEFVTLSIWDDLTPSEVAQIWAEGLAMYRRKESTILSPAAEAIAKSARTMHSEVDERKGIVEDYLNLRLPSAWQDMDAFERSRYVQDPDKDEGKEIRKFVCIAEIWCECLGRRRDEMDRYKTREVNDIMKTIPGWTLVKSTRNFKLYGKQKYYERN